MNGHGRLLGLSLALKRHGIIVRSFDAYGEQWMVLVWPVSHIRLYQGQNFILVLYVWTRYYFDATSVFFLLQSSPLYFYDFLLLVSNLFLSESKRDKKEFTKVTYSSKLIIFKFRMKVIWLTLLI